ncbi:PREDICTED: uncharacterized protein LOC108547088 isoform X2 [Eufriesea mexicana]|uniref:uncharacterized protein LOC108547088 isoform X2 n=1 Tax=Eufriesea mexicana TaxID=516756 RepID=UPI00083C0AEA|nr:PREDICTED: uncharacterized protein LOC108547088 isoform X2 [Eufriesea mexicana]
MFMIWGDWFTGGVQSVDTQSLIDSVIITNKSIIRRIRVPTYEMYKTHWRNDPEIQRKYWAASFLLPIGIIFILALIVLLMVLFKRCPQMVAAIVGSILGIIIIFTALISINHTPIYI